MIITIIVLHNNGVVRDVILNVISPALDFSQNIFLTGFIEYEVSDENSG